LGDALDGTPDHEADIRHRAGRIEQHRMQVVALQHPERRRQPLGMSGHLEQLAAIPPAPDPETVRADGDPLQRQREVKRIEHAPGIGGDLQAGAELAEAGALLDDGGGDTATRQGQGHRQPPDASAGDRKMRSRHSETPSAVDSG
jgi:hypothetical protein